MKTSYIINETDQTFQLKEGNAGAFRWVRQLEAKGRDGSSFDIKVDSNATYREYMVATGKKGETIIITSDDFRGDAVIKIIKVEPTADAPAGSYKLELSEPDPSTAGAKRPATHASELSQAGGEPDSLDPSGPSIARRQPDPRVSNQNEHVPWYKKILPLRKSK